MTSPLADTLRVVTLNGRKSHIGTPSGRRVATITRLTETPATPFYVTDVHLGLRERSHPQLFCGPYRSEEDAFDAFQRWVREIQADTHGSGVRQ